MVIVADLAVPVDVLWKYHAGEFSRTIAILIAIVCLLFLNLFILLAVARRYKRLQQIIPLPYINGSVALAVLAALATATIMYSAPQRNDYVELAVSNIPLDQIHPATKALVVDLMRHKMANSRNYEHMAARMKPVSPAVFSPDSFANPGVIRSVSDALKGAESIDLSYGQQQRQADDDFRSKMTKLDPDYLKSFDVSLRQDEAVEDKLLTMEAAYVTATVNLYAYADAHSRDISVRNGEVQFRNDKVRAEFSQQLQNSKALYQKFQDSLATLNRQQDQRRADLGMPPKL